jgi:hypothetical protein
MERWSFQQSITSYKNPGDGHPLPRAADTYYVGVVDSLGDRVRVSAVQSASIRGWGGSRQTGLKASSGCAQARRPVA